MNRREVKFTCPKCKTHKIEEIMVNGTVASEVVELGTEDCGADILYGEQTNEDGHVDRYQCKGCGFPIVSDAPEFDEITEDGLDENALVKAIDALNEAAKAENVGDKK